MASPTETQQGKDLGQCSPGGKMGGLSSWFTELKRRRVFRTLIGYGIAAFAVLQIIEPIMHGLQWPESVLSYVVAALAAGFPVVITLAWIFDVKAGRIERTAPAPAATGPGGVRVALLLVGIGILAAAPGLYFFVRGIASRATVPATQTEIATIFAASDRSSTSRTSSKAACAGKVTMCESLPSSSTRATVSTSGQTYTIAS